MDPAAFAVLRGWLEVRATRELPFHAPLFCMYDGRGLRSSYIRVLLPRVGRKAGLAMAVRSKNAHYTFHTIQARHWQGLALKHGGAALWQEMQALVARVEDAIAAVQQNLPSNFPERTWLSITQGMRAQVEHFEAGPAA